MYDRPDDLEQRNRCDLDRIESSEKREDRSKDDADTHSDKSHDRGQSRRSYQVIASYHSAQECADRADMGQAGSGVSGVLGPLRQFLHRTVPDHRDHGLRDIIHAGYLFR